MFPVVYFAASGVFGYIFYIRFWKWRDCIDEALSSCVTPEGDNLTQGGMFWALPAIAFLFAGLRRLRQ